MRISAGLLLTRQLASCSNRLTTRPNHTSASPVMAHDKVYELRTYNIWPQHLKAFLTLTTEQFHLRTAQSKLIGYWTSELGGLNEVVHIWEYDNLEHRAQVRQRLAGNTEWIELYFAKILPMMSGQQNAVVSLIPGISYGNPSEPTAKGFYQLQTFRLKNLGIDANQAVKQLISPSKQGDGLLIGAFQTLQGNINEAVLLWKHPTLSAATNFISTQLKDREIFKPVASGYSKILLPHQVSPLQ